MSIAIYRHLTRLIVKASAVKAEVFLNADFTGLIAGCLGSYGQGIGRQLATVIDELGTFDT